MIQVGIKAWLNFRMMDVAKSYRTPKVVLWPRFPKISSCHEIKTKYTVSIFFCANFIYWNETALMGTSIFVMDSP